jgi:hypothetical protein
MARAVCSREDWAATPPAEAIHPTKQRKMRAGEVQNERFVYKLIELFSLEAVHLQGDLHPGDRPAASRQENNSIW